MLKLSEFYQSNKTEFYQSNGFSSFTKSLVLFKFVISFIYLLYYVS